MFCQKIIFQLVLWAEIVAQLLVLQLNLGYTRWRCKVTYDLVSQTVSVTPVATCSAIWHFEWGATSASTTDACVVPANISKPTLTWSDDSFRRGTYPICPVVCGGMEWDKWVSVQACTTQVQVHCTRWCMVGTFFVVTTGLYQQST